MSLRRIAALSGAAILLAAPAFTARRPRYGGKLVVEIGATVNSVDQYPAVGPSDQTNAKAQIASLIYDHRNLDGTFSEPGPFRVVEWEPGKHAVLAANEDYKVGRPFVDTIEIRMGRGAADRVIDLELGKADLTAIPVDLARRLAGSGVRITGSNADELIALTFSGTDPESGDARVREAIACSIDRAAMVNFILQKEGEPAGGLLPQWLSGTAFLFATRRDIARAKELRSQINPFPPIVLGYDSDDPLSHAIGERIVVNARDAGISITTQANSRAGSLSKAKARLVRLEMPSPEPRATLVRFLNWLNPGAAWNADDDPLPDPATPEQIYEREAAVVKSYSVIPIAWIPHVYGLSARVRDWKTPGPGERWPLAEVWLEQTDAQPEKGSP